MLSRLKRVIVGRPPQSRTVREPAPVPNFDDVPDLRAGTPGGLAAVDRTAMSRYLGRPVVGVEPLRADLAGWAGGAVLPGQPDRNGNTTGWRVHFEDGVYVDVRLQPVGVAGSAFPDLQARFLARRGGWGDAPLSSNSIATDAVGCIDGAPHETYYQGALLVSRGAKHEAVVEASSLASPRFRETMAGIAVLALRLVTE
jgi:hypothetical protein